MMRGSGQAARNYIYIGVENRLDGRGNTKSCSVYIMPPRCGNAQKMQPALVGFTSIFTAEATANFPEFQ
jgi:hypothetical protein